MWHMFTTKRTELFKLDTFWALFFVFSACIGIAIALSALKMNCLAHILFPTFFALPRFHLSVPRSHMKISLDITTSPRAGLNRWPRPYQGRALPTELQGHESLPPAALANSKAKIRT